MPDYFEFEVTLRDIEPRIWRRFLLTSQGSTFSDLHVAIQDACGWQDSHLFQFSQPGSGLRKVPIAGLPTDEGAPELLVDAPRGDCAPQQILQARPVSNVEPPAICLATTQLAESFVLGRGVIRGHVLAPAGKELPKLVQVRVEGSLSGSADVAADGTRCGRWRTSSRCGSPP